jgi:hypothetical protein
MANENSEQSDPSWSEWLVIETLGFADGIEPTVVAKGSGHRSFTSIERRTDTRKTFTTIQKVIPEVFLTGDTVLEPVYGRGVYERVVVLGVPIIGPSGVFGVQIWAGNSDATPPTAESVGTFEFDVERQVTKHGPGHDEQILGLDDGADTRTLQEIWKHFDRFDAEEAYREYLDALSCDEFASGESFDAPVYLTDANGIQRRIDMSVRARIAPDGRRIVGLLHDTTEGAEKVPGMSDRQIARAAAQLTAQDADAGLGHLDLNTGIVFEWLKTPPPPFDQWERHNPEFHPKTAEALDLVRSAILDGSEKKSSIPLHLRFPGDDEWLLADMTITAIGEARPSGGKNVRAALIQIGECVAPPAMW